ncbi:c-type cytochrome [Peredibacter starrii]|uniref:C-type cytochrome n=1 Tax=Peredibacter starrii TaxID=28202 RepID=A0AAX4HNL2_9BACT|nr:c-type cytochrome [Peredibacter starrii]WPU64826.1 c-type cytochrome [Peredibacter starrii]
MKLLTLILMFLIVASAGATEINHLIDSQPADVFTKGEKVYKQYCMACHAPSNIMVSSPKFGDRKDWGERLANNKTLEVLVKSAVRGKNAMPKKGRCVNCKESDLKSAVLFMMRGEVATN